MARQQVDTIERSARLRPQAGLTDTYVRPADPGKSPLWDLADALSQFDGDLKGWMNERKAQGEEDDFLRGKAARLRESEPGYAAGVRSGKIPAYASPGFKRGYKQAEGDYAGQQFDRSVDLAYETWDKNGDFDQWSQEFVQKTLKTDDPDVLRGLLPRLESSLARKRQEYTAYRSKTVYENGLRSHIAAATASMETFSEDGLTRPEGVDYGALWGDLMARRETAFKSGITNADYDKQLVESIVSKAIEKRDPSILALLNQKLPGSDHTIRNDPLYREAVQGSEEKLMEIAMNMEEQEYKQAERAKKEKLISITGATMDALSKNPNAPIPEDILVAGTKLDPRFRLDMLTAQKTLSEGGPEDQTVLNQVMLDVMNGGGEKSVLDALRTGHIKKPGTFTNMLDFAKKRQSPEMVSVEDSLKRLRGAIKLKAKPSDIEDLFGTYISEDELAANRELDLSVSGWLAANPKATDAEKRDAIDKIGKSVLDRIDGGDKQPAQKFSPADANNPFAPPKAPDAARPGQQQQQQDGAPGFNAARELLKGAEAPPPPVLNPNQEPPPVLDTLPPTVRSGLEERASKLGVDPQVIWERMWQRMDDTKRGVFKPLPPAAPPAPTTPGPQGSNDTNPLLGLIQSAEAGQAGFDSVYSGRTVEPPKPVSTMTVAEVMDYQEKLRSSGSASTAVGAFQTIQDTLAGAVVDLGLQPDALFDETTQTQIAMHLMEKRGLSSFLSGDLPAEDFIRNLSQEWAGLPGTDGKSYYAGDGLNASTVQLQDLKDTLVGLQATNGKQHGLLSAKTIGKLERVARKDGRPVDIENLQPNMKKAITTLTEAWPDTLQVNSGFRDKKTNKAVGGAKNSDHTRGDAIDINVADWPTEKRIAFIKQARAAGFKGIGVYTNAIHIGMGKTRMWGPDYTSKSIPDWAKSIL